MGADRAGLLDQRTRRWICEACETEPATVPQIVERMRERGWHGGTGSLWSTVRTLVRKGYLRKEGTVARGRRRPSPLYLLEASRRDELREAILRHTVGWVEAGDELLIIPVGGAQRAAAVLRSTGPEVTWAMRTGDSSVGLVVVLDHRMSPGARDALLGALQGAGVERIAVSHVLARPELETYCDTLVDAGAQLTLPPIA